MRARKIATCDAETDPFEHGKVPHPFIWGYYDGKKFLTFDSTKSFVQFIVKKNIILFAHNGGKFDFMYLIQFLITTKIRSVKVQIISGRVVSVKLGNAELRDSFAAVPQGLASIDKDEIEYWKMGRDVRNDYMPEIINYLKGDCVKLYNLMSKYMEIAGKKKTISSNALYSAKKMGIDPGKTNYAFDSKFRRFYFGGRTQCFQPGEHKNVTVVDINSSYPYAMIHDHATGSHQDFIATDSLDGLDHEQINRAFIRLKCFAHGCFPTKNEKTKEMSFPNAYGEYFVTGWEYNTAKELGLIEDETIFTVDYSPKTINFFKYVNHWYEYKAAHNKKTHPIEYTIGKILMCSLYGKLAQNIENYWDYKIVPLDTEICRDYMEGEKPFYCANCGEMDHEHGWSKTGIAFGDLTLHCRESLWRAQFKYGAQWRGQLLYKNVATGASITGFARAYLLRAIASVGLGDVIYVDTDSLIMREDADFSGIPISPRLGDWEIEIIDAPRGLFVGKKTYGIDLGNNEPCTCNHMRKICKRHKIASKGSKLTFSDIEEIARGGEIQWKNEAPSFSLLTGKLPVADVIDNPEMFLVRSIRQTA